MTPDPHDYHPFGTLSRRQMLRRCGAGIGTLALSDLLAGEAAADASDPMAPKAPHFPARAKAVIHIFANGGPSQIDTFDPKPDLEKHAGEPLPGGNLKTERKTGGLLPSPFKFKRYGESGIEVSELFSRTAEMIDDIAVIRSMHADVPNHEPSLMLMNTGDGRLVRPSMGSWLTYGLGTENRNLPAFIALCPGGYPIKGTQNWQAGFLPGVYQGTYVDSNHTRIDRLVEHITNHRVGPRDQREQLDLLQRLNHRHRESLQGDDGRLESRIQSFELAYRMQGEAAEAFDVSREPQYICDMYGPGVQNRQALIARRLVERGVRYVQLWHGAGQPWDSHDKIAEAHRNLANQCDQGIAALLKDLKQRGLLKDTLVIWGGEFGRTPAVELAADNNAGSESGRDHNHYGFTTWMAGGGVKGGQTYGATDEFGYKAVENRVHVHDLHATILKLMGFDHRRLTYRYAGRDFRLTDVHGRIIDDLIA